MGKLKARIEYKLRGKDLFLRVEHMGEKWTCVEAPHDIEEGEFLHGLITGVSLMSGWDVSEVVEI